MPAIRSFLVILLAVWKLPRLLFPCPPPPPAEALSSSSQVEQLSSGSEAVAIPNARQHPEEEEITSNPPDSNGFSMLHFLSTKTPTPEATPKQGRRIPRVAIYSPLGGAGCSTIAAGLAWLLANNDQSPLMLILAAQG